ncbi:MAG: hypothetical protein COW08_09175, partial [Ignavibacteriales bacterium CG12_big_fil_rev_8_21_14_0_65_30_8]
MLDKLVEHLLKLNNKHFLFIDIGIFVITPILSLLLKFNNFNSLTFPIETILFIILSFTIIKILLFKKFGLYNRIWKYASIDELIKISVVGIAIFYIELFLILVINKIYPIKDNYIWLTLSLIDTIISVLGFSLIRFIIRASIRIQERFSIGIKDAKRVLIVGAGDAGLMITEEIQSNEKLKLKPVGYVDDDRKKTRTRLRGLQVLGTTEIIPSIVDKYQIEEIIIAMPTAPGNIIRKIYKVCEGLNVKIKTIPGVFELLNESVSVTKLRNVQIQDLLRREPVQTDITEIKKLISNKKILITGGGGSIGSEIVKQVMFYNPKEIIIVGHGENSIFEVLNKVKTYLHYNDIKISQVIADIRDKQRINQIIKIFKPEIIFHAAAHKHVPLMESNPSEAVSNNIFGTLNLCELAIKYNVENFVLISSDKAVNPSSIMGATKRVAELIIKNYAQLYNKKFASVRFGNVLGSRGSVIPYFKSQIAKGGPITITHPDIKRYFMTIPEAVQLVLQAATMANNGEVFILDMGEPIKILDLAEDLIKLSGLEIYKDIDINFIG